MELKKGCVRRELAADGGCRVDLCSHGTVHIAIGDVTLRLSRKGFEAVTMTLNNAAEHLDDDEQKRPRLLC